MASWSIPCCAARPLDETQFAHCALSRVDLRGAQGRETAFLHCEATQVSLEGALFDIAAFRHGSWSQCTFAGATLRRAMFDFTDLQHADFSGVQMEAAYFFDIFVGTGECLPTLDWTGIREIRLAVWQQDQNELRQLLDGNGVPAMLHKAPERLRTQAISSYLAAMVRVNEFSPVAMSDLFKWTATQPSSYLTIEAAEILIGPYRGRLKHYRDCVMPWPAVAAHLPGYLRAAVMLLNGHDGAHWAREHAIVVLQLQLLARRNDAPPEAAQWADRLRTAYRAHLPPGLVRAVVSIADDNDGDDDGVPLLAPDGSYALLVPHDYYVGLIRDEPQGVENRVPQWMEVYRLTPPSTAAPADAYSCGLVKDVARDLAPWPLLATTYGRYRIAGWQEALLAVVPVGKYKGDFEAVFRSGAAPRKLVEDHQDPLRESFGPVLRDGDSGIVMTLEHRQALLDTMPEIAGDAACEGYFLLCLATMFVRLSSWRYFGDHDDGPWALRAYAAALWRAAVQRKAEAEGANDGDTFARIPKAYGAPWTAEALTTNMCTDMLSGDMVPELKELAQRNERYRDILATVWVPQLND
ncbi:hypothetical protein OJJOAM_001678 [Cupriavidus sp. H18C1]|uniref:pentapeptide repeat-containing protein n=1 Tax=Cupriavidus sp. H18C1 TaxID=3241601 RepID=UPI003BB99CD7